MTSKEAAEKWNLSKRQVNSLCAQGKITGAQLIKGRWIIPDDSFYGKTIYQMYTPTVTPGYILKEEGGTFQVVPRKYLNIGNDGFRTIRNSEYIDKSGLITFMNSCLATPRKLICVSRPRRFGKSFGAKMLCAYYSKGCDSSDLFADLKVARDDTYARHLNRHDLIYLDMSFFISTLRTGEDLIDKIEREVIEDLANSFPEVCDDKNLIDAFTKIVGITGDKLILIIDEWDAPFREFKDDTKIGEKYIHLLRSLFKSNFTDRLFDGVYMTGILPIKKYGHESAMSDFYEYSMVEPRPLQEYIGFTEDEVIGICDRHSMDFEELRAWYDGYHVGDDHLFNPKSVMESILRQKLGSYWTKTETYESLRDYIDMNFDGLKDAVISMIGGASEAVDTNSFQNDLTSMGSKDDVLTLLIHLGYLAYDEKTETVTIPNDEIRGEFIRAVKNGNRQELVKAIQKSDQLLDATWNMDEEAVSSIIEDIHTQETAPNFYNNEQALRSVIKMAYVSSIDYYTRIEELPTGKGYADMVFWPKKAVSCPALIVELKWNKTSDVAYDQITNRQYEKVLKAFKGDILKVGISYNAKSKKHSCKISRI